MRVPERASVKFTYEPSATTVPAISSRPPLDEPATSFVVQVVLYVPSSLIRVTMSPWTCPESPVMTCPNDPRHVPLRSDSLTDAAGSAPARADAACVLDVAQPAARTTRASANGMTDMDCRIFVPSLLLKMRHPLHSDPRHIDVMSVADRCGSITIALHPCAVRCRPHP